MTKDTYFAQGMIKVKENDHHGAIELFSIVLKEDPENADALSQRAVAYLNIEEYDLSMKDMNAAVAFDPDYGFRYQARAYLKARIKDYAGSIADYEKAVALDPTDSIAYNNLALAQEQMGWNKQAQSNFEKSDTMAGIKTTEERANERKENALKASAKVEKEPVEMVEPTPSKGEIAKSVFTNKNTFKEFIQFIKNGFKIKE